MALAPPEAAASVQSLRIVAFCHSKKDDLPAKNQNAYIIPKFGELSTTCIDKYVFPIDISSISVSFYLHTIYTYLEYSKRNDIEDKFSTLELF